VLSNIGMANIGDGFLAFRHGQFLKSSGATEPYLDMAPTPHVSQYDGVLALSRLSSTTLVLSLSLGFQRFKHTTTKKRWFKK
jgi:hypothetical protein